VNETTRDGWTWLGRLLDRPDRPAAIEHAICRLGFSTGELLDGLSDQLALARRELENADPAGLARCRRWRLGATVPAMLRHRDPRLSGLAHRILVRGRTVYELEPESLERLLVEHAEIAEQLAPRLAREGLALLGPSALRRLASAAPARIAAPVGAWVARLRDRG
jgi:hypothetical protein